MLKLLEFVVGRDRDSSKFRMTDSSNTFCQRQTFDAVNEQIDADLRYYKGKLEWQDKQYAEKNIVTGVIETNKLVLRQSPNDAINQVGQTCKADDQCGNGAECQKKRTDTGGTQKPTDTEGICVSTKIDPQKAGVMKCTECASACPEGTTSVGRLVCQFRV